MPETDIRPDVLKNQLIEYPTVDIETD